MKWFSAPVPRYDGTVALGLAGGTAQQPLGYQFRVGLDNTGEILGGAGGIVVLRPNSKGGAAVIVAVQPQALVDRLLLSRNIDAGSGLGLQKMPERLLICVWRDKGRPSTFPIYVYRSDQNAMQTDLYGRFATQSIGFIEWAVAPSLPENGRLIDLGICTDIVKKIRAGGMQEAGLIDKSAATPNSVVQLPRVSGVSSIYHPGIFSDALSTWTVTFL